MTTASSRSTGNLRVFFFPVPCLDLSLPLVMNWGFYRGGSLGSGGWWRCGRRQKLLVSGQWCLSQAPILSGRYRRHPQMSGSLYCSTRTGVPLVQMSRFFMTSWLFCCLISYLACVPSVRVQDFLHRSNCLRLRFPILFQTVLISLDSCVSLLT